MNNILVMVSLRRELSRRMHSSIRNMKTGKCYEGNRDYT